MSRCFQFINSLISDTSSSLLSPSFSTIIPTIMVSVFVVTTNPYTTVKLKNLEPFYQ